MADDLGQCRNCMRRRPVHAIGRQGGGSYRRGGRWYRSSICSECALDLLSYVTEGNNGQTTTSSWSIRELRKIVEKV